MHLTEAEWKLMDGLWADAPASARELLDRLGPDAGWAYTTVKTMLTRLVEKGALDERARGRESVYVPRVTRKQARRSAVRALIERAFGGTAGAFVHHLVAHERLSAKEKARLRAMLDELDRRAKS